MTTRRLETLSAGEEDLLSDILSQFITHNYERRFAARIAAGLVDPHPDFKGETERRMPYFRGLRPSPALLTVAMAALRQFPDADRAPVLEMIDSLFGQQGSGLIEVISDSTKSSSSTSSSENDNGDEDVYEVQAVPRGGEKITPFGEVASRKRPR